MRLRHFRILVLLLILIVVSIGTLRDNNPTWERTIWITVYPVNADGRPSTQAYIDKLSAEDFSKIGAYYEMQAKQFNQRVRVQWQLGNVAPNPPPVPSAKSAGVLSIMLWSLKLRWYAYRYGNKVAGVRPDLRLFLRYHTPTQGMVLSETSTALQKGRIGVVHLFADNAHAASNLVVMAHEALHGFGATDKYDLRTGVPLVLGEPDKGYPQNKAELMAMHIAKTPQKFVMARNLSQTVVGVDTAKEIGWVQKP